MIRYDIFLHLLPETATSSSFACVAYAQAGNILIDQKGQVILADMGVAAAMARTHRLHDSDPGDKVPSDLSAYQYNPGDKVLSDMSIFWQQVGNSLFVVNASLRMLTAVAGVLCDKVC